MLPHQPLVLQQKPSLLVLQSLLKFVSKQQQLQRLHAQLQGTIGAMRRRQHQDCCCCCCCCCS